MNRRHRSFVALIASTVALSACASSSGGSSLHPNSFTTASTSAQAPVKVTVQNDNFYDVAVYALLSGVKTRIGTVAGHGREVLRVSASMLAQGMLQLVAHPIGTGDQTTLNGVMVSPGQEVAVVLMPVIEQSYASAR